MSRVRRSRPALRQGTGPVTRVCSHPDCPVILIDGRSRCDEHSGRPRDTRPSAASRGYGVHWRRIRAQFLRAHPTCSLCREPATVADHHPLARRELVAAGDPHPDAWVNLRPLCESHHNAKSGGERR